MRQVSELWLYHWATQILSPCLGFCLMVLKVSSDMVFPASLGFFLSPMPWELHLHSGPFLGSFPICTVAMLCLALYIADPSLDLLTWLPSLTSDLPHSPWTSLAATEHLGDHGCCPQTCYSCFSTEGLQKLSLRTLSLPPFSCGWADSCYSLTAGAAGNLYYITFSIAAWKQA